MQVLYNNIRINEAQKSTNNKQNPQSNTAAKPLDFSQVLDLQFSKHANMRLNSRDINLTNDQMQRVEKGVLKAQEKGIRDSLVMVDDVALLVNVKSKTVITAIGSGGENVFTNIDGAVFV